MRFLRCCAPRLLAPLLLLAPLGALGQPANLGDSRLAPIDDPLRIEFRSPPADLSADKVRQAISIVAAARGWKIAGESAGALQLTRTVGGKHMMKIELAYDPAGYDIRYLDSLDLMYREVDVPGKRVRAIHRNYNLWIRELAASINSGLAVGASMSVASAPRVAWTLKPGTAAAAAAAPAAAAKAERTSERLPQPGDYWRYSFRDERYRRRIEYFTVDVAAVDGWKVSDLLGRENGDAARRLRSKIDANELAFISRRLSEDYFTFEIAPYLAASDLMSALQPGQTPGHGPKGWKVRVASVTQERVQVPAGSFDATRVEIAANAELASAATLTAARQRYTLWYAQEPKRYVQMRHQAWSQSGSLTADEIVRLEEFRLK